MLGLPYLAQGALLEMARALRAPILLSANGFSVWTRRDGVRQWLRFGGGRLHLLDGFDAYLDSAGFVAARRYGGYPWTIDDYLDLAAQHPFRWFAAMDYCVEPEIAHDRAEVTKRIRMTARSLRACIRGADERGIRDRLMPVVQGRTPSDYARCLDLMGSDATSATTLGVGSVCRRPVWGPEGVVAVVDRLHEELGDLPVRLHLFGVKSRAAALLATHPRVASFDSQAYGTHARFLARKLHCSKTNAMLASVMRAWYSAQLASVASIPPGSSDRQGAHGARRGRAACPKRAKRRPAPRTLTASRSDGRNGPRIPTSAPSGELPAERNDYGITGARR
jgi:hypothetical protein